MTDDVIQLFDTSPQRCQHCDSKWPSVMMVEGYCSNCIQYGIAVVASQKYYDALLADALRYLSGDESFAWEEE
jgi:hypothetical protein